MEIFNGFGFSTDIGSQKALTKEVVKLAKQKGYKTSGFYKMSKARLKAIYYKLKNN